MFFPARLSGSRVAYALGIGDERYGTPLQEQRRLLGSFKPDPIPDRDPDHPACQGQAMEATILQMASWRWEQRHGHPIEVIHAAAMAPRTAEDPAGGLRLEHPTEPLECHPDAYFLCRTCNTAWLVDAKRYSSSLDAEAAKDELRAQLAFNLAVSLAARDALPLPPTTRLSSTAIGAVLRMGAARQQDDEGEWFTRSTLTPDCLEVETTPEILAAVVRATSEWVRTFVLPWFEGAEVPDAPPRTYEDILLMWPEPTPDKVLEDPSAELIALIDEHSALTEVEQGAHIGDRWWSSKEIDARRSELRTAILLLTTDHEAIAPSPGADCIATLKADRFGNRHVRYAVKSYNQARTAAAKRAAKKGKG